MKILSYFNYREFPDGNHRIREELSSYGSAGDEIKYREAPDKNGRVGMSGLGSHISTETHTVPLISKKQKKKGKNWLKIIRVKTYIWQPIKSQRWCMFRFWHGWESRLRKRRASLELGIINAYKRMQNGHIHVYIKQSHWITVVSVCKK